MGPEINSIPDKEMKDWEVNVGAYYADNASGTSFDKLPFAIDAAEFSLNSFAKNGIRGYASLSDDEFIELLCEGLYSKFLCHLDPFDTALFANFPLDDAEYEYFKSDFSCMKVVEKTWPGEFAAPTIALLRRKKSVSPPYADDKAYEILAIALAKQDEGVYGFLSDMIFEPAPETDATPSKAQEDWTLLKYFVLQGAIHRINLIDHVRVHFPTDPINAVTKTVLPQWHLIHQLLIPHFWLHLPVDKAVLEGARSLINRDTWYPWSPFVSNGEEIRKLLPFSWAGTGFYDDFSTDPLKFNSSYLEYHFSLTPETVPDPRDPSESITTFIGNNVSEYSNFLKSYYQPILTFTTNVVSTMKDPNPDPTKELDLSWLEIQHWAYEISKILPSFPDETMICNKEVLAKVLAMIIWNDAVCHSGDHGVLHKMMDSSPVPFILRLPPPSTPQSSTGPQPEETIRDALGKYWSDYIAQILDGVASSSGLKVKTEINLIKAALSAEMNFSSLPLCWPTDTIYSKLADLLFYRPHNVSLLYDCEYEFTKPEAEKTDVRKQLEQEWTELGRPVLLQPEKDKLAEYRVTFQSDLKAVNSVYYKDDGTPVVPGTEESDGKALLNPTIATTGTPGSMDFNVDSLTQGFVIKDSEIVLNKWGFPKLMPGSADICPDHPKRSEAAVRQLACIGAGVQY